MSTPGSQKLAVQVHIDDSEDPPHSGQLIADAIEELVEFVLGEEGIPAAEIGVVLCGDERIAELNETWLNHQGPTDVLSFDLSDDAHDGLTADRGSATVTAPGEAKYERGLEGEIYINLAQADRQAPQFGATHDEEIRRLIVHGMLHLIGFDDAGEESEAERMRTRQEQLVAAWNTPLLRETG
jgi:probable rRNA maturation factor